MMAMITIRVMAVMFHIMTWWPIARIVSHARILHVFYIVPGARLTTGEQQNAEKGDLAG
jgi:hypothetical protein